MSLTAVMLREARSRECLATPFMERGRMVWTVDVVGSASASCLPGGDGIEQIFIISISWIRCLSSRDGKVGWVAWFAFSLFFSLP